MTKGFKRDGKFIPITDYNKKGTRKSRDQTVKTEGVRMKRNEEENIISAENYAKRVAEWRENSSDLYKLYVNKFPNSSIAMDLNRGGVPNHGHFALALYEGRYEDAMYRADFENLIKLKQIGIEYFLSKKSRHPDDLSSYDVFMNRYNSAKDNVKGEIQ